MDALKTIFPIITFSFYEVKLCYSMFRGIFQVDKPLHYIPSYSLYFIIYLLKKNYIFERLFFWIIWDFLALMIFWSCKKNQQSWKALLPHSLRSTRLLRYSRFSCMFLKMMGELVSGVSRFPSSLTVYFYHKYVRV